MHFTIAADTDVGISKKINQDSFIIKKALIGNSEIVMAIICDGMGGLSKWLNWCLHLEMHLIFIVRMPA